MIRNGGIVGSLNASTRQTASGVWDTFDNYNHERSDTWPAAPTVENLTFSGYSFNSSKLWFERHKKTVTVNFKDLYQMHLFYITYTITTGESLSTLYRKPTSFNAFSNGADGSGYGTFEIEPLGFIDRDKSTMSFYFEIRRGGMGGEVFYTSDTFNVPPVELSAGTEGFGTTENNSTHNKSWTISNLGRSTQSSFTVTKGGTATEGVDYITTLPYSFNTGGIDHNSQVFTLYYQFTSTQDLLTEGNERAEFEIYSETNNRLYGINADIYDASVTPNITSITPNTTTAVENSTVTFTVTDSLNQSGGPLFYSLSGVQAADVDSLNGSFTMTNGSGTFSVFLVGDGVAEGESFTASVRHESVTGSILGTSPSISIADAAIPLGESLTTAFWSVAEFQTPGTGSNVTDNYSVSEVQQDYNGDGRLYLIQKPTALTGWANDVPIACIQVLDSFGSIINEQWWFGDSTIDPGWTTHRTEYNFGPVGSGVNITPAQASVSPYTYSDSTHVSNGSHSGGFSININGTGSSNTGALHGIAEPTSPMPLGLASVPQVVTSWFMYKEQSGGPSAAVDKVSLCRSPVRTWTAGEIIRIAYIIGNNASLTYVPTDSLFLGIQ